MALVHDWLTGMRGGEKVLEQLCLLFPRAPVYTLFHFPGSVSETIESHDIRTSRLQRLPFLEKKYRSYLPLFPRAIEAFDLAGFDLIISTSHCVAKGVWPAPGAVHVCYCHTPMRYAWDQQRAYFPDREGVKAQVRDAILARLRIWDVESSLRCDHFVANSSFVADRIRRYYGRTATVVAPPVDLAAYDAQNDEKLPETSESAEPFVLAVAALAPYKKLDVAIDACKKLDKKLVLVGTGPDRPSLERHADSARVEIRGRVLDDELKRLYRQAQFFVQPGIEDFGIAAVEALASQTPVVALGEGGILDIVESGRHGVLYEVQVGESEVEALVAALERAETSPFLPQTLVERASQFSQQTFRENMLQVVDELTA